MRSRESVTPQVEREVLRVVRNGDFGQVLTVVEHRQQLLNLQMVLASLKPQQNLDEARIFIQSVCILHQRVPFETVERLCPPAIVKLDTQDISSLRENNGCGHHNAAVAAAAAGAGA